MGGGGSKTHTVYVDRAPTIQQNIEINRAKTAVLNTQAQQEADRFRADQERELTRRQVEADLLAKQNRETAELLQLDIARREEQTQAKLRELSAQDAALQLEEERILRALASEEATLLHRQEELRIAQEKVGATEQRIEGEIAAIKESRAKDLSALQEAQTDLDQTVEKYGGTSTTDASIKGLVHLLSLLNAIPQGVSASGQETKLMSNALLGWIQELKDKLIQMKSGLEFVAKGTAALEEEGIEDELAPLQNPAVLKAIKMAGGPKLASSVPAKRTRVVAAADEADRESISESLDAYRDRFQTIDQSVVKGLDGIHSECTVYTQFDMSNLIPKLETSAPSLRLASS